ncbi:hypothetical protein GRI97_11180 [Altererythrobacter xixiisoli]|uniref:DUF6438 domain-containing protein n=1 Tax=Croceibacterium xixiisoli TaxID=1476466 RepID=A0A6I4TWB4_9SPHN|nr:DUF6438 domain-containing protein [Croceibacterium xixiisoli]MXO99550.1 hypothetical protein [Croceibacterium xixiisoli]
MIDAALAESGWQRMIRSLSFWNGEASRTEQALEAARQWRFRAQQFDGRPVQAVGIITIKYLQPEIAASPAAEFPNGTPADTEMMLERTGCYGSCPAYKVSISGQGRVRFSADGAHSYVAWSGIHETRVSPQVAAELIEAFRSAHFAGLRPACEVAAIDSPTYLLTLRRGGRTIRVEDHLCQLDGMPASVTALQDMIDRLAGTRRWIIGNVDTVAAMKAEGLDLASPQVANIAAQAIRNSWGDRNRTPDIAQFLTRLVDAGARLDLPVDGSAEDMDAGSIPLGRMIALFAARFGEEGLFAQMASRGYVASMTGAERDTAFANAAGCSAAIARTLLSNGADPHAQSENGNAWHALGEVYGVCHAAGETRRAELAEVLIAAQVSPGRANGQRRIPLHNIESPAVVRGLIRAGADLDAKGSGGETPLMTTQDDRVALILLRAGADPHAGASVGALRARAREYHWPATLAWLDAKGL